MFKLIATAFDKNDKIVGMYEQHNAWHVSLSDAYDEINEYVYSDPTTVRATYVMEKV